MIEMIENYDRKLLWTFEPQKKYMLIYHIEADDLALLLWVIWIKESGICVETLLTDVWEFWSKDKNLRQVFNSYTLEQRGAN